MSGQTSAFKGLHGGGLAQFGGITQAQTSQMVQGQLTSLVNRNRIGNATGQRRTGVNVSGIALNRSNTSAQGSKTGTGGRKGRRGQRDSPEGLFRNSAQKTINNALAGFAQFESLLTGEEIGKLMALQRLVDSPIAPQNRGIGRVHSDSANRAKALNVDRDIAGRKKAIADTIASVSRALEARIAVPMQEFGLTRQQVITGAREFGGVPLFTEFKFQERFFTPFETQLGAGQVSSVLRMNRGLELLNNRLAFQGYERYQTVGTG